MFRIVCDPSSGSMELYLTENRSGSLMFPCAPSVFGSVILNQWYVCTVRRPVGLSYRAHTHHWFKITLPNTDQAHDKRQ